MELRRQSRHTGPAGTLVRHAAKALMATLATVSLGCRQEVCVEPITIEPISIRIEVDVRQTQGQQANSPRGNSPEAIENPAAGADPNAAPSAWLPVERPSTHG
jgi:hypothetical protein